MAYRETQNARMNDEQERMHSTFHAYAYGLLRAGQRQEAITRQLIEQGVEQSLAHDISSFAAVSYHSDRREALQNQLGRGLLFLIGGLLFTAFTYALAPGGLFLIATGAIFYGLFQSLAGVLLWANKRLDPEGSLRIATCLLLLPIGIGLLFIAEIVGYVENPNFTDRIGYWTSLLGGYLLGGVGVWGLVDKRAMRLRTGDPEIDALTPEEVGKAGKFLLVIAGVIVLHVVVSQLFFRGGGEGVLNNGFLSPLFTAFDSPLLNK